MLVALLLVVYIGAIGVAAGAWVLKVLIIGASAAAVLNRLLDFVA
jgi:hypothetical protein